MDTNTRDSIQKLRKLREQLCTEETQWKRAFEVKDAIVKELNQLKSFASDPEVKKSEIVQKIDSLLIFVDPNREKDLEGQDA